MIVNVSNLGNMCWCHLLSKVRKQSYQGSWNLSLVSQEVYLHTFTVLDLWPYLTLTNIINQCDKMYSWNTNDLVCSCSVRIDIKTCLNQNLIRKNILHYSPQTSINHSFLINFLLSFHSHSIINYMSWKLFLLLSFIYLPLFELASHQISKILIIRCE